MEVLKIRLEELYDSVDYFVLVESNETFRGNEKNLFFKENLEMFQKYQDKIIHVICPNIKTHDPWAREAFQRNYILNGLKFAKRDDIILISDVDEIPNSEGIVELKKTLTSSLNNITARVTFFNKMYRFYINLFDGGWYGTTACSFNLLKKIKPENLRGMRKKAEKKIDGGWHFTSLGGEQQVLYKLASFSHNEFDIYKKGDLEKIIKFFCSDPLKVNIDSTFPKLIRENLTT